MTKYNLILNISSGTAQTIGSDNIKTIIDNSGLEYDELIMCEGSEMSQNIDNLSKSKNPLLIGGGDGTIRTCAQELMSRKKAFGIIPFGTMNMLASDIGVPNVLEETFQSYKNGYEEIDVDAAFVNGILYLCAASIGTMPSASKLREENREVPNLIMFPQLFLHTLSEFQRLGRKRINLVVDSKKYKFRSPAIVVANNKFVETDGANFDNFKRGSLNDGLLAVYATRTKNIWGHLRLLAKLLVGKWLDDVALREWDGKTIIIDTKLKTEQVSIDGDLEELKTPLKFTIEKSAIKLLKPIPPKPETPT